MFTFLGVRYTIKNENKKARKEEIKEANKNKPRLEIVNFSANNVINNNVYKMDYDCEVLALKIEGINIDSNVEVSYDASALDDSNLIYSEYFLKNTGLTEIDSFCITSNFPKSMCVIDKNMRDYYYSRKLLNYDIWSKKRFIKPGDCIRIRIFFIKDKVIQSPISYPFTIWLNDVNGRYWEQKIDGITNSIEISTLGDRNLLFNNTNIDKIVDCFKNPSLW